MSEETTPQKAALYAEKQKIYPQKIAGKFRTLKWKIMGWIFAFYFLAPWIRWDRGEGQPDQAILASLELRRLYLFNIEIWPQEIYYLTGLLVLAAVGLFLATAMAGRVWCGFTCWQTVWTDFYVWIEEKIEGDRNKRMRLDQGPWTGEKVVKKTVKHILWIFVSALTGMGFLFFFNDAPTTFMEIVTAQGSLETYGFAALFAGTTYLFAGITREDICIYMCPWPRFQGAMFDEHSLLVTYEAWRGEPRGKAKQKVDKSQGDCVDCNLCVNVCPTGIDIRDGDNFKCIGCALCVDACNSVMTKLGRPLELVTYDSSSNQMARERGLPAKKRLIRRRTIGYGSFLAAILLLMAFGLSTRSELEINVQRDRAPLFVPLSTGDIQNGYTFKLLNMINTPQSFTMSIANMPAATMTVIGVADTPVKDVQLTVAPDQVATYRIFVRAPRDSLSGKFQDIVFRLQPEENGAPVDYTTQFAGPDK
ncbi:MAG: cytochrome c oxidase accessory protein CcoG [Alphaproteobacteria bacterium]|nr:cytochrome c oxidase accessory protein CcoG [Alphaproteobacteria bacterium]